MKCVCVCGLLVLTFALLAFEPAHAAWSSDPTQNTPVCTTTNRQGSQKICEDGRGGYYCVWHDYRNGSDTNMQVFAQRIDTAGNTQWQADGLMVGYGAYPKLITDGQGGLIVSRQIRGVVWVQRLASDGTKLWGADGIDTGVWDCGWLCSNGAGGVYVMGYASRVNLVTANGSLPWAVPVLYDAGNSPWAPKIIDDGCGDAILTWIRNADGNAYVQRVDASGGLLWNGGNPLQLSSSDEANCPRIINAGCDGVIVTWDDARTTSYQVYGQRIDLAGALQWPASPAGGVLLVPDEVDSYAHGLAPDGADGFYITWKSTSDDHIFAMRYGPNSTPLWGASVQCTPTNYPAADVSDPPVKTIYAGNGTMITTWEADERADYVIRAQALDGNGNKLWGAGGTVLSIDSESKCCGRVAANGYGGGVVIWNDWRNHNNNDVYIQGVDANGALGNPGFAAPYLWTDHIDMIYGWDFVPWLGAVNGWFPPWIYHDCHGWMWPVGTSCASLWLYTLDMQWLWTGDAFYPHMYRLTDNAWLFYAVGTSNPRWFFNYSTSQWEAH